MKDDAATIRMLKHDLAEAEDGLRKFAADLERHPASAFEWSGPAFEAAAVKFVFTKVLGMLKESPHLDVLDKVQREVVMRAKRGSRSTSDASNLMQAEVMTAWARALDLLQYTERAP